MNDKVICKANKFKTVVSVANTEDIYGEFYKMESGEKLKKLKLSTKERIVM